MKEYGIVVSGDAATKGIGCMTDERWKAFYDMMVAIGMFDAGIDYHPGLHDRVRVQGPRHGPREVDAGLSTPHLGRGRIAPAPFRP